MSQNEEIDKSNLQTIDEIHDAITKKIKDDGNALTVSLKFSALKLDSERIKFFRALLKKYNVCITLIDSGKDESKSERARNYGNEMYKVRHYDDALIFYNESIAFAKNNGKNLALAYGNRSAVLFQMKQYAASLQDIEQAKICNYPADLLNKLQVRQKKCEQFLNNIPSKTKENYITDSIFKGFNKEIPCVSAALDLKYDSELGRRLVANCNIQPGAVLAEESPFISSLLANLCHTRCSNCLCKSFNLIPCPNCSSAMYCSKECMNVGLNKYHDLECSLSASIKSLMLTKIQLLSFRVAICALTYYNSNIKSLKKSVEAIEKHAESNSEKAGFSKDSQGHWKYRSDKYEPIHCLVSHSKDRKTVDLCYRTVVAAALVIIFQQQSDVGKKFTEEEADFFGGLILHHLQTSACNMHTISELADDSCDDMQLGNAAFAVHSLFNHSCSPNVTRYNFSVGGKTIMRTIALLPIDKGEEIFDNYGYEYYFESLIKY